MALNSPALRLSSLRLRWAFGLVARSGLYVGVQGSSGRRGNATAGCMHDVPVACFGRAGLPGLVALGCHSACVAGLCSLVAQCPLLELFHSRLSLSQIRKHRGGDEDGGCLLYTSDAADEEDSVDLGGRRI